MTYPSAKLALRVIRRQQITNRKIPRKDAAYRYDSLPPAPQHTAAELEATQVAFSISREFCHDRYHAVRFVRRLRCLRRQSRRAYPIHPSRCGGTTVGATILITSEPVLPGTGAVEQGGLRQLREAKCLSQEEMANLLEALNVRILIATIKRVETGHPGRYRIAREFARLFGVPVEARNEPWTTTAPQPGCDRRSYPGVIVKRCLPASHPGYELRAQPGYNISVLIKNRSTR